MTEPVVGQGELVAPEEYKNLSYATHQKYGNKFFFFLSFLPGFDGMGCQGGEVGHAKHIQLPASDK